MSIILDVVPGSPEWMAARFQCDCASEAPAMMDATDHLSRADLVRMKALGLEKEFSDYVREKVLEPGHAAEAAARPIIERQMGEKLYPVTMTTDDGKKLASLDGTPMSDAWIWEHKRWNAELVAMVRAQDLSPKYFWQLEHQLLVHDAAEKVIFTVSDGTEENCLSMEYFPVPSRREALIAGWVQFNIDRANYVHVEPAAKLVAAPIEHLPAVAVSVSGHLAVISNLEVFGAKMAAFIEGLDMKPSTDQAFTDTAAAIAELERAEAALLTAKSLALSQTAGISDICAKVDSYHATARTTRLLLSRLLTDRKTAVRAELIAEYKALWTTHLAGLNERLGKPYMPTDLAPDFADAISGKKLVSKMRDACETALSFAKINANAIADKLGVNLNYLREHAVKHAFLFADTATIIMKAPDDFQLLVKSRIAEHEAAEQKKADDLREKIRLEEEERAQSETAEKNRMLMSEISGIQQQVYIASLGRSGLRKGGTIECIRETLAETEGWVIDEAHFGGLTMVAQGAKDKAIAEIQKLLADAEAAAATPAPAATPMPTAAPTPAPTHAPAPVANVVPMGTRAPAADSSATIQIRQINERLAPIQLTAEGLATLGFTPVAVEKAAKLFRESDLPRIAAALIQRLEAVRQPLAA